MTVVETYSYVDGIINVDGVQEAKGISGTVNFKRAATPLQIVGEYAERNVPGPVSIDGAINAVMDDGLWIQKLLNTTTVTGSANTLKTAAAITAAGLISPTSNNANNGIVGITLNTAAITTGGDILLDGTDINGNKVTDRVTLSTSMVVGTTVYSSKPFNTVTTIDNQGVISATGTLTFASVAGAANAVPGAPKLFTIIIRTTQGTNNIIHTMNNCFFTSHKFEFSADTKGALKEPVTFLMKNPNVDYTFSYVNQ